MADETQATETGETEAATEAAATAVPTQEPVAAPVEAARTVVKAKRPARKAAASKRIQATAPASKPLRAAKAKPAPKPARKRKIAPVRAGVPSIQGVETMTKQTRNGVEAGLYTADQMKTVFGDVNERAKAAVERSAKMVEEFADITRGNVEALVASSKVAAKGVEALSQDAAEYSRKSFEEASSAFKSFAEVKSPTDFFKLQSDFARAAFDSAVAESARLSETVLKLAGEVAEPITNRYNVAAERVKSLAA
ncbi:phasin family protein [Sphingosinicella terrae]|jgi:phasin family protein|uniref:phasin family protein n=1 Tax=Sphingosinicella terrae TaxID=2172047 RepID=UPI000E0DA8B7|nr:phasin family protein [Sphingosinicella terrae]